MRNPLLHRRFCRVRQRASSIAKSINAIGTINEIENAKRPEESQGIQIRTAVIAVSLSNPWIVKRRRCEFEVSSEELRGINVERDRFSRVTNCDNRVAALDFPIVNAQSATPRSSLCYAIRTFCLKRID